MSPTSASDYPTLGFDPTPGDHAVAQSLVGAMRDTSDALGEIKSVLHGADDGEWRGQAAIAFRDLLDDEFRPKIDDASNSFADATRVLDGWAATISSSQARARRLEERAGSAAERIAAANATLDGLPEPPGPNDPPPETEAARDQQESNEQTRRQAQNQLSGAQSDLDDIVAEARQLADDYQQDGRDAAQQLQAAMDIAPNEPGLLDSMVDGLGDLVDAFGDLMADLGDMLLEHLEALAPLLKIIGDVAGLLSAICGLLAFIPGLQFLAVPALILGGVALAAHYLEAAGESGSFLEALTDPDVIMDAVGLALGIGALKVGGQLVNAARATGNTRVVPQLIGPAQEVAPGMFSIMRSTSYQMELSEFAWRTVNLKFTQASLGHLGLGAGGNFDTLGKLFTWDWGPITQKPSVR